MYSLMQMGVTVDINQLGYTDAKWLLLVAAEIQHKQEREMKRNNMRSR